MSEDVNRAYVARVSQHDPDAPHSRRTFYAVVALSQNAAYAAIREVFGPSDYVEMTDGKLSPETAATLGLVPDVVMRM